MFGREDVCRYLPWTPMDLDRARAKLEQRMRQTRIETDGDPLVLIAVESDTERAVGEFMLRLKSLESRQAEIGWSLHPDAQGRGLATEGARELLRIGFDELGLHRIVAGCDSRNTASLRVMELPPIGSSNRLPARPSGGELLHDPHAAASRSTSMAAIGAG